MLIIPSLFTERADSLHLTLDLSEPDKPPCPSAGDPLLQGLKDAPSASQRMLRSSQASSLRMREFKNLGTTTSFLVD